MLLLALFICMRLQLGSNMAPKAKAAAKAAPVRPAYNARGLQRRVAVGLLNGLAETFGVKKIVKKTPSPTVEAFVRRLEEECEDGEG